jgi:hypothetical protein
MRADRVERTEAAAARVTEWAVRFARNLNTQPTFDESVQQAANILAAIQRERKFRGVAEGKISDATYLSELTMASCCLAAAMALLIPKKTLKERKNAAR